MDSLLSLNQILIIEGYNSMYFNLHAFSLQLLNMSEEHMEDGFPMASETVIEDGDMTRLMLQHCGMPAYQFIIQVEPDQTSVSHFTFLVLCLILCLMFVSYTPAVFVMLAGGLFLCSSYEDGMLMLVRNHFMETISHLVCQSQGKASGMA